MPSILKSLASVFSGATVMRAIGGPVGVTMPENPSPTATLGVGSAQFVGGYLASRELNAKLVGKERYRTLDDVVINIEIAAAGTRLFQDLVRSADWSFPPPEGYEDDPEAKMISEAVTLMAHDATSTWSEITGNVARFKHYDFSINEWTLKKYDEGPLAGKLGILDVELRENSTIEQWIPDENGTIIGVVQRSPMDFRLRPLPRGKIIYRADRTLTDRPDGIGLLRHTVRAHDIILRYEDLEASGFENSLRGMPVGRVPYAELREAVRLNKMTKKEADDAISAVRELVENHVVSRRRGVLVDSGVYRGMDQNETPSSARHWDIETITTDSTAQKDMDSAIERKRHDIAIVLYAEVLLVAGRGAAGSFAAAIEKGERLATLVNGVNKEVGQTIRADLLRTLVALNGWPREKTPVPTPTDVSGFDVVKAAQVVLAIAQAGRPVQAGDNVVDVLRTKAGLPAVPEDVKRRELEAAMLPRVTGLIPGQPGQPGQQPGPGAPAPGGDKGGPVPSKEQQPGRGGASGAPPVPPKE